MNLGKKRGCVECGFHGSHVGLNFWFLLLLLPRVIPGSLLCQPTGIVTDDNMVTPKGVGDMLVRCTRQLWCKSCSLHNEILGWPLRVSVCIQAKWVEDSHTTAAVPHPFSLGVGMTGSCGQWGV